MNTKTDRWARELYTAQWVQRAGREIFDLEITIEQAHLCWSEHSDDYCAEWLAPDAEDPRAELRSALTKFQARHGKLPMANNEVSRAHSKTNKEGA